MDSKIPTFVGGNVYIGIKLFIFISYLILYIVKLRF